jgi:hypothetical protein
LIDFDSYAGELPTAMIEDYKFVYKLTLIDAEKVGFDRSDADGVVSAVVLKNAFPNKKFVFIPLSHHVLKLHDFGSYLSDLKWFAIADLPPFPVTEFDIFCDHHRSSEKMEKMAKKVLFNPDAPSAAYLLAKHFYHVDDQTKELADLTVITDTAGFNVSPPLTSSKEYNSEQERAWALNDACKIFESSRDIVELVERLSSDGFDAIPKYYNRELSSYRVIRRRSVELAKKLEPADLIILNFTEDSLNNIDMVHEMFNMGAKVGITSIRHQSYYKLSFRHSKTLSAEERMIYRLDELAQQFGGGGHVSASGAEVKKHRKVLEKIISWGEARGLKHVVHDIKNQ